MDHSRSVTLPTQATIKRLERTGHILKTQKKTRSCLETEASNSQFGETPLMASQLPLKLSTTISETVQERMHSLRANDYL